jgi:hypothetical protein
LNFFLLQPEDLFVPSAMLQQRLKSPRTMLREQIINRKKMFKW